MKKAIMIAAVFGLLALAVKQRNRRQGEWHGMTEEQARARLGERLPGKMPDEAKAAVTDKIVDKMRDKGVIVDLTDGAADTATSNGVAAEETTTA